MRTEPEITAPVDLCLPDGRLNRAAVGWSRHPLQRCNLRGRFPRKKRWEFWGVLADTHLLFLTYGAADYMGTVTVGLLDFAAGKRVEHVHPIPLARGMRFPETVAGDDLRFAARDARLAITEEPAGTHLVAWCRTRAGREISADMLVARPPGHETLNVVVPWDDNTFQFTSKQNTRPATGHATLDGARYDFSPATHAFGILDFGRGIWPYRTTWNWGAASGHQGGHVVGLNLGGKWTDGTGTTENGFCLDGRLHKIDEDLRWEYDRADFRRPWRIRTPESGRVDLEFVPAIVETQRLELVVIGSELHWALGRYRGTVTTDDGERVVLDGLLGWAEEHRARW